MTKIRSRPPSLITKERRVVYAVSGILLCISIWGGFLIAAENIDWKEAWSSMLHYGRLLFFMPRCPEYVSLHELLQSLGISLALSVLTTIGGALIAFFLALGAARNLAPSKLSKLIRCLAALIRAVPTIIWVLVFSVTVNVGTDAAVIGMCFHSIAYLIKGFSESFEQINRNTIEALKACGAGFTGIITQAVIPVSASSIISWTFFRFEINFINAVAIGAAAGSGGIGYHLFVAGNLYFDIEAVGFITYIIFVTVILLEMLSVHLRKKIKPAERNTDTYQGLSKKIGLFFSPYRWYFHNGSGDRSFKKQ